MTDRGHARGRCKGSRREKGRTTGQLNRRSCCAPLRWSGRAEPGYLDDAALASTSTPHDAPCALGTVSARCNASSFKSCRPLLVCCRSLGSRPSCSCRRRRSSGPGPWPSSLTLGLASAALGTTRPFCLLLPLSGWSILLTRPRHLHLLQGRQTIGGDARLPRRADRPLQLARRWADNPLAELDRCGGEG
jgi:hypothetical protein